MKKFNHGKMITIMTLIMAMLFAFVPQMQQEAYAAGTWPEKEYDLSDRDMHYHGPWNYTDSCIGISSNGGKYNLGNFYDKQRTFEIYLRKYEGSNLEDDNPTTGLGYGSAANIGGSIIGGKGLDAVGWNSIDSENKVKVRMHFIGLKNEKIIRLRYEIKNEANSDKKVTLGGTVAFNLYRSSKSRVFSLGKGVLLKSPSELFLNFRIDDGNYWWGTSSVSDMEGKKYLNVINKAHNHKGRAIDVTEGANIQPGLSWLWESIDVPAGKTVYKDCYFGVGAIDLGDDPYRILTAGYPSIIKLDGNGVAPVDGMPEGDLLGTDENYQATLPTVSNWSKVFEGWYDSAVGGNKVADGGDIITARENTTLYAHWRAVTSTVNLQLKAGSDPYLGQTVQLYEGSSNTPKYSLTEKTGEEQGTYSTGGVSNGTYYVGVNGRRTGDTLKIDAMVSNPNTWITNAVVEMPKATVTTRLDGTNSDVPGKVTLRERGKVVYEMDKSATGEWWSGVAFDEDKTPLDIYVDGADTGEDIAPEIITPNSLNKTIDFDTISVEITDDAAWEDANVALKDSNGRTAYVLPYKSSEGKTTTYSRILPRNGETYKVFVDGMDTGKTVKADGTNKQADVAFYTSTLSVSCSDADGLPMTATLSGNNRKYNYKKGTPEDSAVTYTAKHVLSADAYTLDVNGVSAGGVDINKDVSAENKDRNLTVRVIDFQKYTTEDNTSFTPSSDVKGYVFNEGKISSRESRMDGFTFSGWSEAEWTPGEGSYTAFDFRTAISKDMTLYPHYLSPTVKISGLVRTDADGKENRESGDYYRMPYLTITGFDTGEQSVKLVMFEGENVESIDAKNLPAGATFENGLLTFDPAVSMNEARDYVRDNIVVKPAQKGDGSHEAGTMTVTVIDKNGSIGTGYDGGDVTGGVATGTLTGERGQVLEDKTIYTVSEDTEITGSDSADTARERSGLIVPDNGTVYIYVPEGKTLTVTGGDADNGGDGKVGQKYTHNIADQEHYNNLPEPMEGTGDGGEGGTGAGAGIYLRDGSKLYLLGGGKVTATGGDAGNGGNGGNGGDNDNVSIRYRMNNSTYYISYNYDASITKNYNSTGGGGGGGAGGGGAGAGIGGSGGTGGNAGNGGGANPAMADNNDHIGASGTPGQEGDPGSACGDVYSTVRLITNGGAAGTGGAGGDIGENKFHNNPPNKLYPYPGKVLPGAGGGGGGAGLSSVGIGSGGGGGGGAAGGGSGSERGRLESITYETNPEGPEGSYKKYLPAGGAGGKGAVNGSNGVPTTAGASGAASAAAGEAGAAAGAEVTPETNVTNSITYSNAEGTEGQGTVGEGGTTSYTPGTAGTITFPTYTADSGQPLKGWKLTQYAANIGEATNNPFADGTGSKLFAAGSTVQIPEGTVGDLVFSPVTSALSGLSAVDTANYDGTSATIFTYTVTTKVGDKATDVGPLTFKVGDTEELVSGINGVYTFTSSARSAQVKYRGDVVVNEMKSTNDDPNPTAEASFEKVKVKVNGYKPSDLTLDNDGPVLACVSSDDATKTYEYESAYRKEETLKGSYEVSCDGTATGVEASYGNTVEVNYHTVTVKLADSDADSVVLRDKSGNALEMTKTAEKTFTYTALEEDKTAYDVYADGTVTSAAGDKGVKFDKTQTVNAGYYVSTVTVKLDGAESDAVGIPQYGDEPMTKTATGVYTFATGSNENTDVSVNGKVAVKDMTPGTDETVEYFSITYAKASVDGETGEVPAPTICQKDEKATLEVNTLKNGAMKFGGWKIGDKTYPEGAEVTVTEAVTATATWSKASLEEPDADGNTVLVIFNKDKFIYNGASQTPEVSVYIGTTELTKDTDYELSYKNSNESAPADEQTIWAGTITVTVTGKGDYSGSVSKDYEIIPKTVSISGIEATGRAYNGEKEVALDTTKQEIAGVADGDKDDLSIAWPEGGAKGTVYDPNVELLSDEEYDALSDDEKAQVETKDGIHYVKKSVNLETDDEGDIKASLNGDKASNYILSNVNAVNALIEKKEVEVTATAGLTKEYGEADPKLTYTAEKLIGDDEYSGELARDAGEAVGDYAINQGTLSVGDNYKLSFNANSAKLTITKKSADKIGADQKEDEKLVYDGEEKEPTLEVKDGDKTLEKGKDYTVKYVGVEPTEYPASDEPPTQPGNYKAIIEFTGNYDGTKDVPFEVEKAEQNPPSDLKNTDLSSDTATDGKITGVDDTMEYSTDGGETWNDVKEGETEIKDLGKGDVLVRYKETETQKPSKPVVVKMRRKPDDLLLAQMTAKGKKAMTIRWTRVEGADGYDIFFSKCNTKGKKYTPKLIKTVRGNGTFKFTKKKLKKKVAYKAYVRAFKMEGGRKQYISTSMMYHGFTSGYKGKYTDAKSVSVKQPNVSLSAGQTSKISASIKKVKSKKILIKTSHAPHLRYVSSNNYIATVDGNGVITAKSGGTCYVYAVATNGVRAAVAVTVK